MKLVLATRNLGKVRELRDMLKSRYLQICALHDFPDAPDIVEDGETYAENACKKANAIADYTGHLTLADDAGLEVAALNGAPGVHSKRWAGEDATDEMRIAKLLAALEGKPNRAARFVAAVAIAKPVSSNSAGFVEHDSVPRNSSGFVGRGPVPRHADSTQSARFVGRGPVPSNSAGFVGRGPVPRHADNTQSARFVGRGPVPRLADNTQVVIGVCEGHITLSPVGKGGFGYDPVFVPAGYDKTFAELGEECKNRISHRAKALQLAIPWLELEQHR